jgi:cytosine/uracil/thiamine/allantoin permease
LIFKFVERYRGELMYARLSLAQVPWNIISRMKATYLFNSGFINARNKPIARSPI